MKRRATVTVALLLAAALTALLHLPLQTALAAALKIEKINVSAKSAMPGTVVTWTVAASRGSGAKTYAFELYRDGAVVSRRGYAPSNKWSVKLNVLATFKVRAYVKDASGAAYADSAETRVVRRTLSVISVKPGRTVALKGATVRWTATAAGGSGAKQYMFQLYKDGTKVATRNFGPSNAWSRTLKTTGTYRVRVFVRDATGTVNKFSPKTYVVAKYLAIASVKADKTSETALIGEPITWTVSASGGAGAKQYRFELYLNEAKIATRAYGASKSYTFTPAEPGSYKVMASVKDLTGEKKRTSACSIVPPPPGPIYRACLVGQSDYQYLNDLHGTYDTGYMQSMLQNLNMDGRTYQVSRFGNRTAGGVLSAIGSAFAGADDDDVSLFYYSGHGVSGTGSYAGSLCGTDFDGVSGLVTPADLRGALNGVPGTVIVILDSCGSGSYIYEKDGGARMEAAATKADAAGFNAAVVSAFRGTSMRTGELLTLKYLVLTACAYNASCYETSTPPYYGFFTRWLCMGGGWDILASARADLHADGNLDSIVTLSEAYAYVNSHIDPAYQVAQAYPTGSAYPLFKR